MRFHFTGICGAGMGNVAMLLAQAGHEVKGSDENPWPPMSDELREAGIPVLKGYAEAHVTQGFVPDVQVIGNAISRTNPEAALAERSAWKRASFPQVLFEQVLKEREVVVIAGTHGKTSTTALLARVLERREGGCFVGGILKTGEPGCRLGRPGAPFAIEGDEYDTAYFDKGSKFMHYGPSHLLLTHLEWDHVDIFPRFEDAVARFAALLALVPAGGQVVHCGDVPALRTLVAGRSGAVSYGLGEGCMYRVAGRRRTAEGTLLTVREPDGTLAELRTPLIGDIYVSNLLGAWTMARRIGFTAREIAESLDGFTGVKRRLERLRNGDPYFLYSDFAHHPTAVASTIAALRQEHPGARLWVLFDPRSASSRRSVFHDGFAAAFRAADRVILGPPHQDARLSADERLDVARLAVDIGAHATGCRDEAGLRAVFREPVPAGTVLAILSCGAFFGVPAELAASPDGRLAPGR